jgi:hypothetical protein
MARERIFDEPMNSTERSRRRRERLSEERAEQQRITETYFRGQPPLSPEERRRLIRQLGLDE